MTAMPLLVRRANALRSIPQGCRTGEAGLAALLSLSKKSSESWAFYMKNGKIEEKRERREKGC